MSKLIIYQVLPRLFGNRTENLVFNGTLEQNGTGKFSDFTPKVLHEIAALGCNTIWYTGVIEHATKCDFTAYGIAKENPYVIKGNAGSPYAIKDYYDVNPYLADQVSERMSEFEALVKRTHEAGLKVLIDFVPNHVARQYHSDAKPAGVADFGVNDQTDNAFDAQNNFYYIPGQMFAAQFPLGNEREQYKEFPAKATGNDCFHAYPTVNDWYETVKLNYGVDYCNNGAKYFDPIPDTWYKMLHILSYWTAKGVNGFRCDMAEMVPVEFWGWVIPQIKRQNPEILFIAEVYQPDKYKSYIYDGHFDYLYDKVGLYDTLKAIIRGEAPASAITGCWQSYADIGGRMLNFLENHDEQRIASPYFAEHAQKAFPALVVSSCLSTVPFMIYSGQELGEEAMDNEGFSGQDGRTTIFDFWAVESIRRWYNNGECNLRKLSNRQRSIHKFYATLLPVVQKERAIYEGLFFDLMYVNPTSEYFDQQKQYTFMRKADKEIILIVANFDEEEKECKVNIPAHAFEYLGIPQIIQVEAKELLTGSTEFVAFNPEEPFCTNVPASGAVIWKILLP